MDPDRGKAVTYRRQPANRRKMLLSSIYIPDEPAIFERAIVRGQGDLTYIYISPWSPFATDR
jgi:hypothetical protein